MTPLGQVKLQARNFLAYRKELGLRAACCLALRRLAPNRMLRLHIRGLRAPFHCRNTLADLAVLRAVLGHKESFVGTDIQSCIIDGGAHIGCTSVVYAAAFPHVPIVAVEPNPANFRLLRLNVAAYPNVLAVHGACWPQRTRLRIANPTAASHSFQVSASKAGDAELIEAFPLPALLQLAGATHCDLLKLDIEGAELEFFRDTTAAEFAAVTTIVVEIHEGIRSGVTAVIQNRLPSSDWEWRQQAEYAVITRRNAAHRPASSGLAPHADAPRRKIQA